MIDTLFFLSREKINGILSVDATHTAISQLQKHVFHTFTLYDGDLKEWPSPKS